MLRFESAICAVIFIYSLDVQAAFNEFTVKGSFVDQNNCDLKLAELKLNFESLTGMGVYRADCTLDGFEDYKLRLTYDGAPRLPIQSASVGLMAGGSIDPSFPISPYPEVYRGAYPSLEVCVNHERSISETVVQLTGLPLLFSGCYHPLMGEYALRIMTYGDNPVSQYRYLEMSLQGSVDAQTRDKLRQIVERQGGMIIETVVMDSWVSVNYVGATEIRAGLLSIGETSATRLQPQCEREKSVLASAFHQRFGFDFSIVSCLADSLGESYGLNPIFDRARPAFDEIAGLTYPSWSACDQDRAHLLDYFKTHGHSTAFVVLCTLASSAFDDRVASSVLVARQ